MISRKSTVWPFYNPYFLNIFYKYKSNPGGLSVTCSYFNHWTDLDHDHGDSCYLEDESRYFYHGKMHIIREIVTYS